MDADNNLTGSPVAESIALVACILAGVGLIWGAYRLAAMLAG